MHVDFLARFMPRQPQLTLQSLLQLYKQHFAAEEDEDGDATADGEDDGKEGSNRNKRQVAMPALISYVLLRGGIVERPLRFAVPMISMALSGSVQMP